MSATRAAGAALPGRLSGLHPMLFAAYAVLFLWSQNLGETDRAARSSSRWSSVVVGGCVADHHPGEPPLPRPPPRRAGRGAARGRPADVRARGRTSSRDSAFPASSSRPPGSRWSSSRSSPPSALTTGGSRPSIRRCSRVAAILVVVRSSLIVPFRSPAAAGGGRRTHATRSPTRRPRRSATSTGSSSIATAPIAPSSSRYGVDNDLTPGSGSRASRCSPTAMRTTSGRSCRCRPRSTWRTSTRSHRPRDQPARTWQPVNALLQDPLVARQFKALGYRYFHIGSWWDPTRADVGADVNLTVPRSPPGTATSPMPSTTRAPCPAIANRLGISSAVSRQRDAALHVHRRARRPRPACATSPGRSSSWPTSCCPTRPFVFDRDGSFMDDEASGRDASTDERYDRQLAYTNSADLREIVGGLLALPERPSGRSSSCRPTRAPGRRRTPAERKTTPTGPQRATERRARAEVRDPQRLVPAGRRGPRALTRR